MIAAAVQGWRPYALLVLLCFGLYLPGLASLPVTDRDEARYAQATRQMLETRDLIAIRFQDEARNKKPAGIYWLQAASVALFSDAESDAIWPYRLPSLVGASAAVLLTFGLGAGLVGRDAAFIGAALLAASLGLGVEAHLAKTDAVLLGCITAAQLALAQLYRDSRGGQRSPWGYALIFWLALAAGTLVKGPVAPLMAALTLIALSIADRDASWLRALRPLAGLALFVLLVLPWVIAISRATDGAFLNDSLGHDFLGKLIGAQESHGAPPLYYLALLMLAFWPGSLFIGPAVALAWRERRGTAERFLLAWAVPFWILLELVPTKLPNYLLPIYPALALICGRALIAASRGALVSWRGFDRAVTVIWAVATFGLAVALILLPLRYGMGALPAGIVAAAIAVAAGITGARLAWRRWTPILGLGTVLAALLLASTAFAFVAPALDKLWLSRAAQALVAQFAPAPDQPIAVAGNAEPSLVFLLGTRTKLVLGEAAAEALVSRRVEFALVESRSEREFVAKLGISGWAPQKLGAVTGIDYSNGRAMVLTLYKAAPR